MSRPERHEPVDCDICDTEAAECEHTMSDDGRAVQFIRHIESICAGDDGPEMEDLRLLRTRDRPDGSEGSWSGDRPPRKQFVAQELGGGYLEHENLEYYLYTPSEAYEAIRDGATGFGLVFGRADFETHRLGMIDNDDMEIWPYDETPSDFSMLSGSGTGYHHYFATDGSVSNANSKKHTPYEGSVRTDNYYALVAGSKHPSGGVYTVAQEADIPNATQEDFPEDLRPASNTVRDADGEKIEIPKEPDEDLADAEFENELGWSLESIRERSDKLDALLTRLTPGGYDGDRSVADASAAKRLWYWGFDRQQIARIMRRYRRYEKTERDDYLYDHTIPFATSGGGERITDHYDEDGNYDPDPMGMLPLARLDALDHDERVRYAKRRNIEWPDVDDVRQRLYDRMVGAAENGETVIISSPTGSGKTHSVATTEWDHADSPTDGKPVVHVHRTREARDQAARMSDNAGVDSYVLKGRKELCEVAAGLHDPQNDRGNAGITVDGQPISEWMDHRCKNQGLPFSIVHSWADQKIDGDLPCERGDTECPTHGQFDKVPRDDSGNVTYDVIHATHQFLHVPSLRMATHIFMDEKPAFGVDLTPEQVRRSVNAYLEYVDAPVDNYAQLVEASRTGKDPDAPETGKVRGVLVGEHNEGFRGRMGDALNGNDARVECPECGGEGEIRDGRGDNADLTAYPNHGGARASTTCPECDGEGEMFETRGEPPVEWYRDNEAAHAMAPAFTRAIWNAEESAGGRKHARVTHEPPRYDQDAHEKAAWNREYIDVVLDEQWEVVDVEAQPDFMLAESVVGLDAHPQPADPMWRANVHPEIETDYLLNETERTLYRRYERGLHTVQVGKGVQPVASGEWLENGQGAKMRAIVDQLRDHYGEDFDSAITSMAATDTIRESMKDAGVDEPEMMWYGNEESRNDFAGKPVGLVAGSIDPGDDMILNLCARQGLDVEAATKECPACEGVGRVSIEDGDDAGERCDTCEGDGEVRERGRNFEGEDAEMATAVLKGVREHHVAQSAGRWARNADDPDDTATVFMMTEASPDGFVDAQTPGVTWLTNEDQRERLRYIRDNPEGATAKGVAEACGCTKQSAWRTMKKAAEEGLLEKTPGVGPYGADVYSPSDSFTPNGSVDLSPEGGRTAGAGGPQRTGYKDTGTYTVTVTALPNCALSGYESGAAEWKHQSTFEWFDPGGTPT